VPRRGRRRREGTRWFADIHATPQAYHASPDAVIHRSAWNRNSANFALTEFSEVRLYGFLLRGSVNRRVANVTTVGQEAVHSFGELSGKKSSQPIDGSS